MAVCTWSVPATKNVFPDPLVTLFLFPSWWPGSLVMLLLSPLVTCWLHGVGGQGSRLRRAAKRVGARPAPGLRRCTRICCSNRSRPAGGREGAAGHTAHSAEPGGPLRHAAPPHAPPPPGARPHAPLPSPPMRTSMFFVMLNWFLSPFATWLHGRERGPRRSRAAPTAKSARRPPAPHPVGHSVGEENVS